MPELPEVQTVLTGIKPVAKNAIIKRLEIRIPKLRWPISKELFDIKNQPIIDITRRAKYLIFTLKKGYIIIHLGMTGVIKIVDKNQPVEKHDHVDIILDNGKILRYNDPRKFGCILWTSNIENFPLFKKLGPEPLTDEFNADYLYKKSKKYRQPIKSFIMQNNVVVGVGNIYASETLFLCKINPLMPTNKLTLAKAKILVKNIKQVLETAIENGGTSIRDFAQPSGKPGYFTQKLNVYGKEGKPCPICKTPIKAIVIAQRNSFYCEKCQPLDE